MQGVEATRNTTVSPSNAQSVTPGDTARVVPLASAPEPRARSQPAAMLSAKGNLPFPVDDEGDPLALVYSTPVNRPLSLAQRTYGTESLFQYYALRGYKEIVGEAATPEAAEAVQACLRDDSGVAAGSGRAAVQAHHSLGFKNTTTSLDSHTIDRCLVSTAAAAASPAITSLAIAGEGAPNSVVPLYIPLRPAQAQDATSAYRTSQVDEVRAAREEKRRERLHLIPEAAVYLSRYYPEGTTIVSNMQLPPPVEPEPIPNTGTTAKYGARGAGTTVTSNNSPPINSATTTRNTPHHYSVSSMQVLSGNSGRHNSNLFTSRNPTSRKANSSPSTSILPLLLRTPQEVTSTLQTQKEERRALADHVEDAFVNAYHLRDPLAVERQRQRELQAAQESSMKAAAALLAEKAAAASSQRRMPQAAGKKTGGKKKKARTKAVAPPKREGGVPVNLEVFRTSLLLVSNDEGAVTLGQLRSLLANVPFHVGTPTAGITSESASITYRLFCMIHSNTRATNAIDAPELLLAAVSATGGGGVDLLSRHGNLMSDNSISSVPHGFKNSISRVSCSITTTRCGPGASVVQNIGGRMNHPSVSTNLHSSGVNVFSQTKTAGDYGGNASSGTHSPSPHHQMAASGHSWKEGLGSSNSGKQQQNQKYSPDLNDENKCVLVLEVLDALDALLNSAETKRVVRWECFNVLAIEGNGYIHKSQLLKLRQYAYRDGSAAEAQAAVTAAMVKTLSDMFTVVGKEEEEAYLKANKRGKKKSRPVILAAHQSSPIPLNVMRKSHIDYATFCRFFDEMPLVAAAFAHVWLPLLLSGRRQSEAVDYSAGVPLDSTKSLTATNLPHSREESLLLIPSSPGPAADAADDKEEEEGAESPASSPKPQPWVPPVIDDNPDALPLEALGSTADARRAAVRKLVTKRQEQLHEACDAAEKEKLLMMQTEEPEAEGAFSGS